jgi:hypothetical protein
MKHQVLASVALPATRVVVRVLSTSSSSLIGALSGGLEWCSYLYDKRHSPLTAMTENIDLGLELQGVKIKTNSLLRSRAARVVSKRIKRQTLATPSNIGTLHHQNQLT